MIDYEEVHRQVHTTHVTNYAAAADLSELEDESIHLVVTSPPYPMIAMWDEAFIQQDARIEGPLSGGDPWAAFEMMHGILDQTWAACARVLVEGGFICVNIGDATRSLAGNFALFPNRARIDAAMRLLGLTPLPDILWRKPSNAPNKFMGSGMLPAGAYVTYEHEYIAIYRKGGKRSFKTAAAKATRRRSAFFWEERNRWFSDLWEFRGARQKFGEATDRERSGAYPLDVPFRLIAMYSLQGDTVLDPFIGTGTTHAAAIALGRSSVGFEIDDSLQRAVSTVLEEAVEAGQLKQQARIRAHEEFLRDRIAIGKPIKHHNEYHGFDVMTAQEKEMVLTSPIRLESISLVSHGDLRDATTPRTTIKQVLM